ncbi:uncharacterized protein LOC123565518 [Mercenaria mercenaria]|uniref:uncharacterized protein LOC123565518 n=1 Tax=Mercenaria mercenaria TaxID=6596 RepID=UPI00234ED0E5|nr:uncharacterized protein LOC123565518 [Mercenaria mercenaria]
MRKKQVKPTKVEGHYRRYSPESLLKAFEAVKEKKVPVKRAARQFDVPENTLRDRVKGRIDAKNFCIGGETTLSREEEEVLVEHVEVMGQLGYGYTNTKLQQIAGELAYEMGKKKTNKAMSNNWLYGFMNRWQKRLVSLSPRSLDSYRAKCSTPEAVSSYFRNLQDTLKRYDLLDKPQNIYNLDETGLQPDHRPPNIIAKLNSKPQAITSPRSTTTTLIGCVNAIGNYVPPFFVFKGKRFNPDLMESTSSGARGEMSESGWSNGDIFKKYLTEHFLPYARAGADTSQPILIIFDGHSSHISPSLIKWARSQNIILFVLPAHTSHILQPLDVSLFGPFKSFYYSGCASFMQENVGKTITRFDMARLACKAYLKSMSPLNIQAGFRKTGIYPLSQDVITMEKLFPAEGFREENPTDKVKALKAGKEAVEEFVKLKLEPRNQAMTEAKDQSVCPTCKCSSEVQKKQTKPKPSGRAITEDSYLTELEDPKPSTSGTHISKPVTEIDKEVSDTEFEEEIPEEELCCICKKWSPPNLADHPGIKLINWAYCDRCTHCVHLAFCSSVRVVRRHTSFLCPCCEA